MAAREDDTALSTAKSVLLVKTGEVMAVTGKWTKSSIYALALECRNNGSLYDRTSEELEDTFLGSIDRFAEIAYRLRNCHRILDVGAGNGLLLALLHSLGHECCAVDYRNLEELYPSTYRVHKIECTQANFETDPLPFEDESFDAVVCCQVLEHFTHSHLPIVIEIKRILRTGGIIEIDVPNVVCFRNRSRMLRGKNITYDYQEHYLYAEPVLHNGRSFFPLRHNREFTKRELTTLLRAADFQNVDVRFLKSRRHREGIMKLQSLGSALRDAVPSLRKSLIAFATK